MEPQYIGTNQHQAYSQSERAIAIMRAWDAYYGRYKRSLKVKEGAVDPNIRANYARVLVDKATAMLFGKEISLDVTQDELTGDTATIDAAQAYLDATWKHNRKMALLQKAAMNGCTSGDVFLQLVPYRPYPRIINLDPALVTVETEPMDVDSPTRFIVEWETNEGRERLSWRQTWTNNGNHWLERLEVRSGSHADFTPHMIGLWPHPFPPIIHWQNLPVPNSYYGQPDLGDDVLHLIDRINLTLSNWNKTVLHHAHPKQWGSGFEAEELTTAIDETTVLPNKDAKLGLLEMKGDIQVTDQLLVRLKEALYEIARLPEIATGKMQNIGVLSGLALNILYEPALELTAQRRMLAGPELEELSRRILVLGGFDALSVSCEWPELLPGDPELEGKVLEKDQKLGLVSDETLSRKRGYDPRKEAARKARENKGETTTGDGPTDPTPGTAASE
ncbi:MAG: phage portal protein [Chloroflexota bacterium]